MCGRFTDHLTRSDIVVLYRITEPPAESAPNLPPRDNVAPTQAVPVVRRNPQTGGRSPDLLR